MIHAIYWYMYSNCGCRESLIAFYEILFSSCICKVISCFMSYFLAFIFSVNTSKYKYSKLTCYFCSFWKFSPVAAVYFHFWRDHSHHPAHQGLWVDRWPSLWSTPHCLELHLEPTQGAGEHVLLSGGSGAWYAV